MNKNFLFFTIFATFYLSSKDDEFRRQKASETKASIYEQQQSRERITIIQTILQALQNEIERIEREERILREIISQIRLLHQLQQRRQTSENRNQTNSNKRTSDKSFEDAFKENLRKRRRGL